MVNSGNYRELEATARLLIDRSARSGIAWKLLARQAIGIKPDLAIAHANLKQLKPKHDRDQLVRLVDAITRTFDATWSSRGRSDANTSCRPVFIVGMPRSGTTLAEQILASHPDVFGAGELTYWDRALTRVTALSAGRAEAAAVAVLADDYLDFHLTNRTVNTVSNWQVRQKINSSSIERWRNYGGYVEPLRGLMSLAY
jgi:hypothetical protein